MDSNELALSVAIIGVSGTLAASIVGHVFAAIRDNKAWAREQHRQRGQRRYDAYVRYLEFAERLHSRCHLIWVEPLKRTEAEIDLVADSLEEFLTAQTAVMIHGSREARAAVPDLYNTVAALVNAIATEPDKEALVEAQADESLAAIQRFRRIVRHELADE